MMKMIEMHTESNENEENNRENKILRIIKDTSIQIKDLLFNQKDTYEVSLNFILQNYFLNFLKDYFKNYKSLSLQNQIEKIRKITDEFFKYIFSSTEQNLFVIHSESLKETTREIFCILVENFYAYLDSLTNKNQLNLKRYLAGTKDLKKLFSSPLETTLSDKSDLRNSEFLVIISNNLNFLLNEIIKKHPLLIIHSYLLNLPVKEKNKIINVFQDNLNNILIVIETYLKENLFLIKNESFEFEIIQLKKNLFDFTFQSNQGILLSLLEKIYKVFGLSKLWEVKQKEETKTKWEMLISTSLDEFIN